MDFSIDTEAKLLALEYMRQKNLTDDSPEDIAREYKAIQQRIQTALSSAI